MAKNFDISLSDSQATAIEPIQTDDLDFSEYKEYAEILNEKCKMFWKADSGVLVYRRMRVAECFSYGCKEMENSLHLQLGALKASIKYKADIPNFLEPWYGIGTISSAFGGEYIWYPGNAPALKTRFSSLQEILDYEPIPVAKTAIGKHTLKMIEYFMDMIMTPEKVQQLFEILVDLSIEFNYEQLKLIRNLLPASDTVLPLPEHGKGWGAIPATFAALLSNIVSRITLKNALTSYSDITENEDYNRPLASLVPGVLKTLDLLDCYRALASKNLRPGRTMERKCRDGVISR